jgi:hypothetical protein
MDRLLQQEWAQVWTGCCSRNGRRYGECMCIHHRGLCGGRGRREREAGGLDESDCCNCVHDKGTLDIRENRPLCGVLTVFYVGFGTG